ncbi:hypothetical protein E2C01_059294 [Portunus trituberculatus]|uniref:Uncharacterized protein n=1 Tax=Portunus trituberculatus TaxID=210409 RepID=A0A5B7H8P5_PORTR|nr:hypothetical protein [Portunus trituberculatus]
MDAYMAWAASLTPPTPDSSVYSSIYSFTTSAFQQLLLHSPALPHHSTAHAACITALFSFHMKKSAKYQRTPPHCLTLARRWAFLSSPLTPLTSFHSSPETIYKRQQALFGLVSLSGGGGSSGEAAAPGGKRRRRQGAEDGGRGVLDRVV